MTRILFAIFAVGLFDHPLSGDRPALPSTPEHVALATRIAIEGIVLLTNRDGLLPLAAETLRSIAVIGTAGDDAQWVMAGSPCVRVSPDRRVTPLEGITARAGDGVGVRFSQGSYGDAALPVVPADVLAPPADRGRAGGGVLERPTPDDKPVLTVVDPTVDISRAPEGVAGALGGSMDRHDHP